MTILLPVSCALLLIDFQRDFLDWSGKMPVARDQVSPVLSAAAQAIAEARKEGDLVVAIGNEFRPSDFLMNALRRHASIAGSEGARWTEKLPLEGIKYFPKWAGERFRQSGTGRLASSTIRPHARSNRSFREGLRDRNRKGCSREGRLRRTSCQTPSRARATARGPGRLPRLEARGAILSRQM